MKKIVILILSVFLLIPTATFACWDDDWDDDDWDDDSWYDDDWDDDWGDDDIAWDNELPELVVTPDDDEDYDWGLDDDWWRTSDPNDDDNSDTNNDVQGWDDEDGGSSSSKNSNGINNNETVGSKKSVAQLTNAAKNTVAEMIKYHGSHTAVCNFGVNTMFKSLFGKNDLDGKKANDMVRYWQNNPSHWEQISISQAQQLANEGYFVVAGWINPSGRSGHVVVIVPGKESYSSKWGCNVPQTMDTGADKRAASQPLSKGFGADKKDNVKFFKYK